MEEGSCGQPSSVESPSFFNSGRLINLASEICESVLLDRLVLLGSLIRLFDDKFY